MSARTDRIAYLKTRVMGETNASTVSMLGKRIADFSRMTDEQYDAHVEASKKAAVARMAREIKR